MAGYEYYGPFESDGYLFGKRGGFACGAGASMTFHVNESLDVRFMCDYHLLPSFSSQNKELLHKISLMSSINIAF